MNNILEMLENDSDFQKCEKFKKLREKEVENYPFLLSPVEILEKLKRGEIEFDFQGHDYGSLDRNHLVEYCKESIICKISFDLEYFTENNEEGKFDDALKFLNKKIKKGIKFANSAEFKCGKCSKRMNFCLKDENTIALYPSFHMIANDDFNCVCEFSKGVNPLTLSFESETGNLVIGNFIEDENEILRPPRNHVGRSIETFQGRRERAKYLADNFNVLYGQMDNMSIEVWANEDNSEILIIYPYFWEYEAYSYTGREQKDVKVLIKKIDNEKFTYKGRLCLGVWCWQAADKKFLEENNLSLDTCGNDAICIQGKPGKWEFTHLYDTTCPNVALFSVIKKV